MAELTGAPIGFAGGTSNVWTTPFPHAPGEVARDRKGNQYVFVEYTGTVLAGMLVSVDMLNRSAALINTAAPCRVGIAMSGAASGNGGWVQIYGVHTHVLGLTSTGGDGQGSDEGVSVLANGVLTVQSTAANAGYVFLADASLASNTLLQIIGIFPVPNTKTSDFTSHNWNTSEASNASGPSTACSETTDSDVIYAMYLNFPYYTGLEGDAVAS